MSLILLLSVILKGVGALLEILLQILITRELGVSGYGNYSTWINAADLIFWVLFSGLVKCNTFYLSGRSTGITMFKKRYYCTYVFPVLMVFMAGVWIATGQLTVVPVICITCLELFVYDQSSTLLARGKAAKSLVGEYVLGRMVLLLSLFLLKSLGQMNLRRLIYLYIFQYLVVIVFFRVRKKSIQSDYRDVSGEVSLRKWGAYQWSDLMYSMISQMPVVLQYFFAGAFEAGVVSIVLLVKKLINFVSGPTAKIFLPEFSRMYRKGEVQKLRDYYASIMRLQMLFVGPLAVVLLGFPNVILRILAEELIEQSQLFMLCSMVFLLTATLGPCGGIMQMTGNEKTDNRCREYALLFMVFTMFLFRHDKLLVLYSLCSQAALEAAGKYFFVCKWMKKSPVSLTTYIKWWIIPAAEIIVSYLFRLQNSLICMIAFAGLAFILEGVREWKNSDVLSGIRNRKKGNR